VADLPRVFEPFQRRGSGKSDGRSLGLGLSLVRRIALAHHGEAHARNRDGGGAVVGIELPRTL
jgi:signal transduction histidine kinase